MPGLVLESSVRHGLDLNSCIILGNAAADQTLARRLGMRHLNLEA
jgi:hypothetical protein